MVLRRWEIETEIYFIKRVDKGRMATVKDLVCGLSLHHGNTESRKNLEQKFIFQLGTLYPHGINERLSFH